MKLWDKGQSLDKQVEAFTAGDDPALDLQLVPYDCAVSKAHARMLAGIGVLKEQELADLLAGLDEIVRLHEAGEFAITAADEDCHTAIENFLTDRCGEAGKKIHTARSRNDQVLTALRLYEKDAVAEINDAVDVLNKAVAAQRAEHGDVALPGFTHTRKAMPASIEMWFGAYAAALADDTELLAAVADIIDQSPLGSAAGFGVPLEIDREATAKELGFASVQPTMYCQNSRGKFEAMLIDAAGQVMMDLARMANDLILFSMPTFGFFSLPAELTTGSSIMPHKQNPDVLELIRGYRGVVAGASVTVKTICDGLISGYHRDLQLTKGPVMRALTVTIQCLTMMTRVFEALTIDAGRCQAAMTDELFATEKVYDLVRDGLPFRDAYRQVARDLKE
ncbi:MAG: argininosuccinate lyase [Planctomycetota bacterium]|jgi:argininosuccinate lyase